MPPEEGKVLVGMQTKKNELVEAVKREKLSVFSADVQIVVKEEATDFRGPCVHGSKGKRFLYLSWKRPEPKEPKWVQRVKIPLEGLIPLLEQFDEQVVFEADITGRKPHETTPIEWQRG